MVSVDVSICPKCGGALKYYGMVPQNCTDEKSGHVLGQNSPAPML